jgi:RNA polymerase sigma factor (sigma-70 family)
MEAEDPRADRSRERASEELKSGDERNSSPERPGEDWTPETRVSRFLPIILERLPSWIGYIERRIPRRSRNSKESQDLLQDALYKALIATSSFKGETDAQYWKWFQVVVLNLLKKYKRGSANPVMNSQLVLETPGPLNSSPWADPLKEYEPASRSLTAEDILMLEEEIDQLLRDLNSIPSEQAAVVFLVCFWGEKLNVSAEMLGISPEVASRRLWRGREALRELKRRRDAQLDV